MSDRWTDETVKTIAPAVRTALVAASVGLTQADVGRFTADTINRVLTALADAGLLLPPGGQIEMQHRYIDHDGFTVIGLPEHEPELWRLLDVREVTRWPDGRYHFAPWREAQ